MIPTTSGLLALLLAVPVPTAAQPAAPVPRSDVLASCGCIVARMPASLLDGPVLESQTCIRRVRWE